MTAQLSLVLPYYNEKGYIAATLASLARQSDRNFTLVLVDNGSTDDSVAIARASVADGLGDIEVKWLSEQQAGKIYALRTGTQAATTAFVGTIDADTIYPEHYVACIRDTFDADAGAVAVVALRGTQQRPALLPLIQSMLFPSKCHGGGYGQSFRTEKLKAAGGFEPQVWPWVLEDHEIMARMVQHGRLIHPAGHWCQPSDRRQDRGSVNWTILERALYKLVPKSRLVWFFHGFLAPRFARRGLGNINLRERNWADHQLKA